MLAAALPVQVLVLAKQPLPGRVKTRLTPPLSPAQAAAVAAACLADTLTAVRSAPVRRRVLVLEGRLPRPDGVDAVVAQRGGGLGARLAAAYDDAAAACALPMVLIGMDTPQVTPELIGRAARDLLADGVDAVLGMAEDGGWWCLGLRTPVPGAFVDVPMSAATTGAAQAARLAGLGLRVRPLPPLRDVDMVEDLRAVLELAPPDGALAALAPTLPLTAGSAR